MKHIKEEVETKNQTYADDFVATLADKLGAVAKANIVFADPIERDGVTVIPVAKARWGFGGGSGRTEKENGAGGGGGAVVTPIGFIEIRNGEANFKRIHTISPLLMAISGLAGFLLMRGLFRRR
jgi:uncharacterized spore protein YtfJ